MKVIRDQEAQGEAEVTTPVEPIEEVNAAIIAGLIIRAIMARLRNNLEILAISLLIVRELIMKNQCLEADVETTVADLNLKSDEEIVATEEDTKAATAEVVVVLQEELVVVEIAVPITK